MSKCECDTCRVVEFIEKHDLYVSWNDGKPHFNCNDLFAWGCSDSQEFAPEDFTDIEKAISEVGESDGVTLWICRKNEMRPQGAMYGCIDREHWPLFDACGPHRPADVGNPVATEAESIDAFIAGLT